MEKNRVLLVIVILIVVGSIYYLEQSKVSPPDIILEEDYEESTSTTEKENGADTSSTAEVKKQEQPLFKDDKGDRWPLSPELVGITGYLNTEEGIKIEDFRGKVVLIDFWTYTCINCIRTLPHITAWDKKYKNQGLVIIGVHTPEFEFEKDKDNVASAMEKHGIEYAVVQDNNYATWRNFKNRYWPRKYLIDSEGYIRYDHIGEGAYDKTERMIQKLLAEIDPETGNQELTGIPDETPTIRTTPELYAGYNFALGRGQNLGNEGGMFPNEEVNYELPEDIKDDIIYLNGTWLSNADDLEAKSDGSIVLEFTASSVNIVADNLDGPVEMEVLIDGNYISNAAAGSDVEFDGEKAFVTVNEPRLYNVYNDGRVNAKLELKISSGFNFNAFTFG